MVRILLTGNRGHVGAPVAAHLERLGHDVVGYDRLDGHDLLDSAAVRCAADGCAAVVHAGALARDSAGSPEDIMAVNVLGTWEYGQFVDVRDVVDAVRRALDVPLAGHHRMMLCAAGIAATEPSLVMAGRFTPSVPVRDTSCFQSDPWRSLFDCSAAARVLGWRPRYRWPHARS